MNKATVHWPERKIIDGYPIDGQPTIPAGAEGDARWNATASRLEMVSVVINGAAHSLVDDPRLQMN